MKEISNSTLALMVVAAILVSVFGSFLSLSKLNQLDGATGYATSATGKANLTVSAESSISIATDDVIELGTLAVNETNTSDILNDWWTIENTGGVNVSVSLFYGTQGSGTYANEKGFGPFSTETTQSGGCVDRLGDAIHTCFQVKCNSSLSGYDCNNTYYPLPASTGGNLIVDLDYDPGVDLAVFGVNVTVPLDEPAGNKEQTVTFDAVCTDEVAGC